MATRNLFRHRRRSILTVLGMVVGMTLLSFSIALTDGSYQIIIDAYTSNHSGQIQIHSPGYLDKPTMYKTIANYPEIVAEINGSTEDIKAEAPRVKSGALAYKENKSMGVILLGVDPVKENRATNLFNKADNPTVFGRLNQGYVVASKSIQKTLDLKAGEEIVMISQGLDGSIANDIFRVNGFFNAQGQGFARNTIFIGIKDAQKFLSMGSEVHEVVIRVSQLKKVDKVLESLGSKAGLSGLDVQPWQVILKDFYNAMLADKKGNRISLAIIMVIVALGVLNTIFMSVLERTREFGVLKAVGTRPREIFKLILLENAMLAGVAIFVGAILSVLVNFYFYKNGIVFEQSLNYGGMEFKELKTSMELFTFYIPGFVVFGTAIFVSLWPAYRASKIDASVAMNAR